MFVLGAWEPTCLATASPPQRHLSYSLVPIDPATTSPSPRFFPLPLPASHWSTRGETMGETHRGPSARRAPRHAETNASREPPHEYKIEHLQHTDTVTSAGTKQVRTSYNHPVKELVWYVSSTQTNSGLWNLPRAHRFLERAPLRFLVIR